jgi:hypothetical protein
VPAFVLLAETGCHDVDQYENASHVDGSVNFFICIHVKTLLNGERYPMWCDVKGT